MTPHNTFTTRDTSRRMTKIDIVRSLRLVLEDQSVVELRENYAEQLHRLCTGGQVDRDWLRHDDSGNIYFLSQRGARLYVVKNVRSAPALEEDEGESLHLVLDQSGSMAQMNSEVYAGAREIVSECPDDSRIALTVFNHEVRVSTQMSKDDALRALHPATVSGTTALRDAIFNALTIEESEPRRATTVVVLTDGFDNASKKSVEDVRNAVERVQARGWRVIFMGCDQNAITTASSFGIAAERALTFSREAVPVAFRSVSENIRMHRTTGDDHFTTLQRSASAQAPPSSDTVATSSSLT